MALLTIFGLKKIEIIGEVDLMPDYVPTGIPDADRILGEKGIPRGHSILICGGPGSGKTTFAIQFLYVGATEHDEPGIYITLDEALTLGGSLQRNLRR